MVLATGIAPRCPIGAGRVATGAPGSLVGNFFADRPEGCDPRAAHRPMLLSLLGLHAVVALLAMAFGRLGRRAFLLTSVAPAALLVWCAAEGAGVVDGRPVERSLRWVPGLGLDLAFRVDALGLLFVALISGVGVAVFLYSRWYFSDRPGLGRFAAILVLFAAAMVGVVTVDNLFALYVFWELTSVTSYLLIGFEDEKGSARAAALQALLVTGSGGLAMLAGFVVLGQAAGTYTISDLLADPPTGAAAAWGVVLVLAGAFTKSAQVPFHFWLPGAMAAPTPVSAYLHSATMVKAGVYLIARFAPAFAGAVPLWRPLVIAVGMATLVLGGWRALRQVDLKLVLAYGTVSQLGLLVVLLGAGHPELTAAGVAMLLAHSLFKAALFLVVGIVDHQAHTRDLRVLSGLGRRMPATFVVAAVATASMAGLPPLLGFVAKESAYEALLHEGGPVLLAGVVIGSVLTAAYGARFLWGAFATKNPSDRDHVGADVRPPAPALLAPAAVLAVLTLLLGVAPMLGSDLVGAAAGALDADAGGKALKLWHGFNAALGLSALTLGVAVALFLGRDRVAGIQDRLPAVPAADDVYQRVIMLMNRTADRVTGIVQNGSLPVYLGVILLTFLVLPGTALVRTPMPSGLRLLDNPIQAVVGLAILSSALATVLLKRRFAAVLSLGGVGFGVAVLFIIQGAPDLALTQLLVETLTLVMFVLVLRHLPERFEPARWRPGESARIVVSVGIGVFVTAFALVAGSARSIESISGEYLARALPEGGGRNVVNVILVDFRGLDTMGEITVLLVAALGIASLVLSARRTAAGDVTDVEGAPVDPDRAELP
jgi:multicomponent Na+:H+ antiporter subunit A